MLSINDFQVGTTGKSLFSEMYDTVERFRTLIPVQDVQVQTGKVSDMDGHYWWHLVHSRSDAESRKERTYLFCNRYGVLHILLLTAEISQ